MKVGISEWSLHQNFGRFVENPHPMTVAQFLDLAGQWKVDAVQIESIPDDRAKLDAIRDQAGKLGLTIEVEACTIDPPKLRQKIEAAKHLGAKVVRTFPDLDRYRKGDPLPEQMKRAVKALKQVAKDAKELDVYVGVENHQSLVTDRVTYQDISGMELAEILDEVNSPFVGACLDAGNVFAYLDDVMETAKRLAPRVMTCHFKDYRIKRNFRGAEEAGCPLGTGIIDLEAIVKLLRDNSPRGNELCLQIESPVERILIPFLDADWWSGYQPADAQRLPAYLKFLAEKGEPSETDFRLPAELGKGLEEILEHEKQYNFQSVQYTRALLARLKA